MLFIASLVLACALADARRIQTPSSLARRGQPGLSTDSRPISVESDHRSTENQAEHSAGTQPHSVLDHLTQFASSIQEKLVAWPLSDKTHGEFSEGFSKRFKAGMGSAREYMALPGPLGLLMVTGLLAFCWSSSFVMQRLAKWLPHKRTRIQHFHEGRVVYEWDQTPKAATIYIKPPAGVKKSDLDIRICSRHLRVGRKGKPAFLREETYDIVNEEMSSWSMRNNGELHIYLQKVRRAEWPSVLSHDIAAMSPKFRPALPRSSSQSSTSTQ